jgi:hypothetical protein
MRSAQTWANGWPLTRATSGMGKNGVAYATPFAWSPYLDLGGHDRSASVVAASGSAGPVWPL